MTPEELMIPRWEVIAGYPGSLFTVGEILTQWSVRADTASPNRDGLKNVRQPGKYPGVFRPLSWWEHRTIEQMPKYVKIDKSNHQTEVPEWVMQPDYYPHAPYLWDDPEYPETQYSAMFFLPATEQEYKDYIKTQQK